VKLPLPIRLACLLIFVPSLRGQSSSHRDDLNDTLPTNPKERLELRNNKPRTDPEGDMLRKLLKNVPAGVDPGKIDPKMVADLIKDNPDLFTPDNLEKLKGLVQEQMRERPNPNEPKIDWKTVQETLQKMDEMQKFDPKLLVPKVSPKAKTPEPPPTELLKPETAPPTSPSPAEEKKFNDTANNLQKMLGDSPAVRDMIKDFGKMLGDNSKTGDIASILSGFQNEWKSLVGTPNPDAALKLSDLTDGFKLPDLKSTARSSGIESDTPMGNEETTSDSSSDRRIGPVPLLLIVLGLGVAGYLYYRRAVREKQAATELQAAKERAAWPIDPARVASRADVVKAFDYLSVSRCGAVAVHWNHQQVAGQLTTQNPKQRDDIDRLAGLYEKARYAPERSAFDDRDVAEARRRLCVLAGVSGT